MHVAHIDPYWISMWIADPCPLGQGELDALCDVLETAEQQNPRVRGMVLE
jgi:hypothetical protein